MTTYRADPKWLDWWTIFYWGWFIGYAPMMGLYVAKVSRGRSIRQIIGTLSIVAPLVTMFWFTVVGRRHRARIAESGQRHGPWQRTRGDAAGHHAESALGRAGVRAVHLPELHLGRHQWRRHGYTVAMAMSGNDTPRKWLRAFWCVGMGLAAVVLITIGAGGVSALQSFIVITAVPVSLLILPALWDAPRIALAMAREQLGQRRGVGEAV